MSTKHQQNLEIIKSVESRGGSAAYQKNPELFNDISELYDEWEKLYKPSQPNTTGLTDLDREVTEAEKEYHQSVVKNLAAQKPIEASKPSSDGKPKFNPPPFPAKEKIILQTFQGFEALGGSAGYAKYLDTIGKGPASTKPVITERPEITQLPRVYDWTTGWFVYIFGVMSIDIITKNHSAKGFCWGEKEGATDFEGAFYHDPWNVMLSAENEIEADAYGSSGSSTGIIIQFWVNGDYAGDFVGDASMHMRAWMQGHCKWT